MPIQPLLPVTLSLPVTARVPKLMLLLNSPRTLDVDGLLLGSLLVLCEQRALCQFCLRSVAVPKMSSMRGCPADMSPKVLLLPCSLLFAVFAVRVQILTKQTKYSFIAWSFDNLKIV
uniref:Uncharacterized protein n=1 Tax=Anguilla anguilla TaxID=7936 RepID=A0A0E9Y2M9_ANGAN